MSHSQELGWNIKCMNNQFGFRIQTAVCVSSTHGCLDVFMVITFYHLMTHPCVSSRKKLLTHWSYVFLTLNHRHVIPGKSAGTCITKAVCYRWPCQILERHDNSKYKSCDLEALGDLTKRHLLGYWNRAMVLSVLTLLHSAFISCR